MSALTQGATLPLRIALAPLAWALAAGGWAARRPSCLVAAALLLVCLPSDLQAAGGGGRITVADVAAGVAVAAALWRCLRDGAVPAPLGLLPFGAVVLSVAAATVIAADPAESLVGFVRYTELFVLVPVAVAMALRDRFDVLLVAGAFVAATVAEGIVGVRQSATNTGASYAGQYVRAIGTFGAEQVMALGALVGYGIVVTLALGLAARGRVRAALVCTAALLVLPLGFSLSRGAWIATACAVVVQLFVFSRRLGVATVATAAFAVGLLASGVGPASGTLDERVTSIASSGSAPDRSVRDRYALWGTAIGIWADHPVLGVGLKDFAAARDTYAPMSLSAGSDVDDPQAGFRRQPLLSAHNQYLMVLAEQGTVGVLAFGSLLGTLTAGAFRRRVAFASGPPGTDTRFLDLVAPGVMVWTLIDFSYGDIGAGPTGVLLAVLLGLVARRMVIVPRTPSPEAPR
ncbi:O-antigen ligase family protein [Dactylosporangium siamense]|uniref:Membrane protein n=1 Tax=Dactylosporangium siamense TaxID=685454 RepID=A0A919U9J1_9ACTN|nr:O-antigen ligase family protein [Dactylosporangium siamense]GIG43810.1 membrane protein [Dactylosporangium siamense]